METAIEIGKTYWKQNKLLKLSDKNKPHWKQTNYLKQSKLLASEQAIEKIKNNCKQQKLLE